MSALDGPLATGGVLCVEASAGTGKTHLLSTLAVRWVVERDDVGIEDLLVVTYTVAAAAELRGRIRARLAEVRDRLDASGAPSGDDYLDSLAAREDAAVVRARAVRALARFDAATIKTVHAFAATALGEQDGILAPAGDHRRQAVADVLAAAAFDPASELFDAGAVDAETIDDVVAIGLDHPDVTLAPLEGAEASAGAFARRSAVERATALFERRQRRIGRLTYADLLTRLDEALADDASSALRTLRARYRVGLIDEFQDTDPTQWRIFSRIFLGDDAHALVVVGDPKQAIYGFRGADVATYLIAKSAALDTASGRGLGVEALDTSYRADGAMVAALNGLFDGARFDEAGAIAYPPGRAAPRTHHRRLTMADGTSLAPLSVRVATGSARVAALRRAIAEECAAEAERALGAVVRAEGHEPVALREDDIVVLCDARHSFGPIKEAFLRRGIRTTEARSDDVVASPAAQQVAVALRAMADPDDPGLVAALAHSWLGDRGGADAVRVARARIAAWDRVLASSGVVALGRQVTSYEVTQGLCATAAGERHLTDLQHLFDLLAASAPDGAGPSSLLEALDRLRARSPEAGDDDLRTRRIDTDAPAVRLMTVHSAKGLEFGVVLCPFVQRTGGSRGKPVIWRDASREGRLVDACPTEPWADARLAAPLPDDRERIATAEAGGEARRLLYVALTRARHRTVVWWLAGSSAPARARDELTGLLLDRDDDHRLIQRPRAVRDSDAACYSMGGDEALGAMRWHFAALHEAGLIEVEALGATEQVGRAERASSAMRGLAPIDRLATATMRRTLSVREQRCSFSSLTAGLHDHAVSLDEAVGDAGASDEAGPPDLDNAPEGGDDDAFDGMRGTEFGSAVHEALEAALSRPAGASFDEVATAALDEALSLRSLSATATVTGSLLRAASAPIAGGRALRDLERTDVATELRFSMPVADGVTVASIGSLLADADCDGPYGAWWASAGAQPSSRALAEALVGSIDLVTTLGTTTRYVVIDYKTNLCAADDGGYTASGLAAAMRRAAYPLQAAIYLVALHRYLRWRVRDYDPTRHLGGAHYLFLRGMRPGTDDGVSSWAPPGAAIASLSDHLAGR